MRSLVLFNVTVRCLNWYERFKPETKLKAVYYYDTITQVDGGCRLFEENEGKTLWQLARKVWEDYDLDSTMLKRPEEIREIVDLKERELLFGRLFGKMAKRHGYVLDDPMDIFPHESEISAALKRISSALPKIGFVEGYGMRSIDDFSPRGYSRFTRIKYARLGVINQGFDVEAVDLNQGIPDDINIPTIAEMREPFSETELLALKNYVERGENLFILAEPRRRR